MTTATQNDTELYDPDNAPERASGMIGRMTISAHVHEGKVTPSYGPANDARIAESSAKYAKSSSYEGPLWYLEAEGIDVVRADGEPFRSHDLIKLQTKNGKDQNKKQAPDQIAMLYQGLGVTASYHPTKVGTPTSAVGRIFEFKGQDLKLGGGYTKSVNLFPVALMEPDWQFEGEARVVTPRAAQEDSSAAADGGVSEAPSDTEAVAILVNILTGKRPDQMLDAILDPSAGLQAVASVFGVPLVSTATDESLAQVLVENGVMQLTDNGKLVPVAA